MSKSFILEKKELFWIFTNIITVKMFFIYPRYLITTSGNAAWMQCIYVSLISLVIYLITINIYKKTGSQSILDAAQKTGGGVLKAIIGIIITITLLANMSIIVRALPESIKTVLLPLTPMRYIILLLTVATALGTYFGLYSIARIHSLFMPIAALIFIAMILLLIPNIDINNIFPILGKGTYNIFIKGIEGIGIFSDILILYLIIPYAKNFDDVRKSGFKAILVSSLIAVIIVLFYNMTYGYPASEDFVLPVYQITRLIKIGDFFQRLEAFFEFVWSISIMLYVSLYLFVICDVWKEIFNLKYYKVLILPFSIIFSALSFLPSSTVQLNDLGKFISIVTIPVCLILPALMGVGCKIKINADKKQNKI